MIEPVSTGTLEVTIGNETARRSISDDDELALTLPTGPCRLTARIIGPDQKHTGVDYVQIRLQSAE